MGLMVLQELRQSRVAVAVVVVEGAVAAVGCVVTVALHAGVGMADVGPHVLPQLHMVRAYASVHALTAQVAVAAAVALADDVAVADGCHGGWQGMTVSSQALWVAQKHEGVEWQLLAHHDYTFAGA